MWKPPPEIPVQTTVVRHDTWTNHPAAVTSHYDHSSILREAPGRNHRDWGRHPANVPKRGTHLMTSPSQEVRYLEPNQPNPFNPVAAICRCWRWALPVGIILGGVTATYMVLSFEPMYRAEHILEANSDYVAFEGLIEPSEDLVSSESDLFFSPLVLDPVLSEPGIRDTPNLADPATAGENIVKNLSISGGRTKGRIIVSYKDTDPDAAALVCNTIVDSYLRLRDSFDQLRVASLERWLAPEIQRWEQEVQGHQQRVARLSERVLGYSPDDLGAAQEIEAMFGLSLDNDSIDRKFEYPKSFLSDLRSRVNEAALEIEILDARLALQEVDREAEDQNQDVKSDSGGDDAPSDEKLMRKRVRLSAELGVLQERYSKARAVLEEFGGDRSELMFARDEMMVARDVLAKLRNRMAAIRTERRRDGAVRSLISAVPPKTPAETLQTSKLPRLAAVAFVSPFLLGWVLGFAPPSRPTAGDSETGEVDD